MPERQPNPSPPWRRCLEDYRRAFAAYHANPASLATTAFLDRAIVRLEEASARRGCSSWAWWPSPTAPSPSWAAPSTWPRSSSSGTSTATGGTSRADEAANNRYAITRDDQITSRYETRSGSGLWVMTYGNRAATHLYTPDEH